MIPGKLDCTRIRPHLRNRAAHIMWLVMFRPVALLFIFCSVTLAQTVAPQYPEIAWLTRSTYCNPYFGFRLALPAELKSEPIYLPVQPRDQHALLAMHLRRLDRTADILISAVPDKSGNSARLAAKARAQQAHKRGLATSGPSSLSVHEHEFYRLRVISDTQSVGNESSYFLSLRGFLLHIAIFSHEHDLAAALDSSVEHHLEFIESGGSACTPVNAPTPAAMASPAQPPEPTRLYYGPALPTELVESTLRESPGNAVPSGQLSHKTFTDPALGVRVELPPGWQALPNSEAYRATELMRDPVTDPENTDKRRALFSACSRVIFTAADLQTEPVSQLHPTLAIAAMPQGCIPDMVPPANSEDRSAAADFATVLARSLGATLLGHGSLDDSPDGRLTFNLDGTLPYQVSGEKLLRRLGLRVSATASGPWLIFVYSVTPTHAAQRDLESRIAIGNPDASSAK